MKIIKSLINFMMLSILILSINGCINMSSFLKKKDNIIKSNIDNSTLEAEVNKELLEEFKSKIKQGQCEEASMLRDEIFSMDKSLDEKVKEYILTSECNCYLEYRGDKDFFVKCLKNLSTLCKEDSYLSKEAQFLLALGEEFGVSFSECEGNISTSIKSTMEEIFKGEEGR